LQVRVLRSDLGFDGRNLLGAASDSCDPPRLASDRVYGVFSRHIVGTE